MRRVIGWIGLVGCVCIVTLGCLRPQGERGTGGDVTVQDHRPVTVTGRLLAIMDGRPVDGGIDLTVETESGSKLLRVPSAFTAEPREGILEMHRVFESLRIGDRVRATGTWDQDGNLSVQKLEAVR